MIRVRRKLARRSPKHASAAAVAALVVALVLLVSVHPISDNVVEHAELACAAAVLALGFALALGGQERTPRQRAPARSARLTTAAELARPALVFNDERSLPLQR